jgi:tRNA/tmRNA/rRNA uracil-C5-methylase (TrmA/RlmC/RlmD family)
MYEKLIFKNTDESPGTTETKNNKTTEEESSEITFRVSPFSFFQTNTL